MGRNSPLFNVLFRNIWNSKINNIHFSNKPLFFIFLFYYGQLFWTGVAPFFRMLKRWHAQLGIRIELYILMI